MFKKFLGFKIVLFLFIASLISLLIMKDLIFGKEPQSYDYKLIQSWSLPHILEEISGITYLKNNKLLCIQDEDGYLFVYNLKTSQIDEKIKFAGGGDYESIALVKDTAYVLRSDGKLFEIKNIIKAVEVKTYTFDTEINYNFEGLYYDLSHNRLLMAPKYKARQNLDAKPIFSFDLSTKQFIKNPVYNIPLNHPILQNTMEFMPSSLNKYTAKNEYYMLDGRHQKLLILDSFFVPKKLYHLNNSVLPQPESLTFKDEKILISTEANRGVLQHVYEIVFE